MNLDIGGYDLKDKIYESVHSIVFRAIRTHDQLKVVLKILKQDYPTPVEIIHYKQEYELLCNLSIDSVIDVYDLLKFRNTMVLVLEDFAGTSIQKLLENHRFTLREKLQYSIKICKSLGEIHHNNIIHKDITPGNIVINLKTQELKIIDFGVSTLFSRERPRLKSPEKLEGTLAYIAPEQTGRMNRKLDYRADYYSLGVLLYELISERLPFLDTEPLELIYSHIARQPILPHLENKEIPLMLSQVIMKLLEKNSEKRYQSAWGIEYDLKECLINLNNNNHNKTFPLARHDNTEQLHLSQKLYGRNLETKQLLDCFRRVSQGEVRVSMVKGYSGIGKTSLIKEIFRPINPQKNYFISGKYDQYSRDIPYSALALAFQELITSLLTETQEKLIIWKKTIGDAVGSNGQVLIDLVPDVELIIGKQPAVQNLGPSETQNRFIMVLKKFFRSFCQPEHPLVIFLDDLQWVDTASIQLIKSLMFDDNTSYLYFIGAFRSNEVDGTHPLSMMLDELEHKSVNVNHIELTNLSLDSLREFIEDSFHSDKNEIRALAQLAHNKTLGNPFFFTQFLTALYNERLIYFNFETKQWQWHINKIALRETTENVVEFMVEKLKKLPSQSINILKQAACIGNVFNIDLLYLINKTPIEKVYRNILPALENGLVIPLSDAELSSQNIIESKVIFLKLKFLHDKVQQAAYSFLSECERKQNHYVLGRVMYRQHGLDNEHIFEIAQHFNNAIQLINNDNEKLELIELNIKAAAKARNSGAYQASVELLKDAMSVLPGNAWKKHFNLTFNLFLDMTKSEYLSGRFDNANKLYPQIFKNINQSSELLKVYIEQMTQANLTGDFKLALKVQQKGLSLLNIELPGTEILAEELFKRELDKINKSTKNKSLEQLFNAKESKSGDVQVTMKILMYLWTSAFLCGRQNTVGWSSVKMANFSLQNGNNQYSSYAYVNYAFILCSALEDYDQGYKFAQLAVRLAKKYANADISGKVLMLFSAIEHWKKPLHLQDESFLSGFNHSLESGDFVMAGYNAIWYLTGPFFYGAELSTLLKRARIFCRFYSDYDQSNFSGLYSPFVSRLLAKLLGKTEVELKIGAEFNEQAFLTENNETPVYLGFYYSANIYIACFFEVYDQVDDLVEQYYKQIKYNPGTSLVSHNSFHLCIILTESFQFISHPHEKKKRISTIEYLIDRMEIWSGHCAINYQGKLYLMQAEHARIFDRPCDEVMQLYQSAIIRIEKDENTHYLALANKLYAKYMFSKGNKKIASIYFQECIYQFECWGATALAESLKTKYAGLLQLSNRDRSTTGSLGNSGRFSIDYQTIAKFQQTLTREVKLSKLLEKLMSLVAKNSGAQKGLLILREEDHDRYNIEAEFDIQRNAIELMIHQEMRKSLKLPVSIVNFIVRTGKEIALSNPAENSDFAHDCYIQRFKPLSILSAPLINQGKIIGIIYLENNLFSNAFTTKHLAVIKIICTHAAILIENAMLYKELEEKVLYRTSELEYRTQFVSLLSKLSNSFIAMQANETDKKVSNALAAIGDFCKFDQIHLYLYNQNTTLPMYTYVWHRLSKISTHNQQNDSIATENYHWVESLIQDESLIQFSSLQEISKNLLELRRFFEKNNFMSGVLIRLKGKQKNLGFVAFDTTTTAREWADSELTLLNIAGEMITSALESSSNIIQLQATQQKLIQANSKLKVKVHLDGLTGIHNRAYFDEHFPLEVDRARRHKREISIMFIDIDNFKSYNDNYGHIKGDSALIRTAKCLQDTIKRGGEYVVRYGGEEFVIILPETDVQRARNIGASLCKAVRELNIKHDFSDTATILTISVGIATIKVTSSILNEAILNSADKALYQAKENGRNQLHSIQL